MTAILEARDVTIRYGDRIAASHVSFQLERGSVLGLIGESGSGKTSVAMALLGLLPDNAVLDGNVFFGDTDIGHLSDQALRPLRGRHLAAIIQNATTSLDPCFTIGSQFVELLRTHEPISRREARTRARDWLRDVGLRDPAGCLKAYPHELSGGMNQRVMIAMALSLDPTVLIADEPTSALDVTVQAQILSLLKALIARSGCAVLVITHDLGVVRYLATDVAVMNDGEIVESGPVGNVFREPQHAYTRRLLASVPRGRRLRSADLPPRATTRMDASGTEGKS